MQATGTSFLIRARDWTKSHPFFSIAAVGILGFAVGSTSDDAQIKDLQSRLATARNEQSSLGSSAEAQIQRIEETVESLEAENSTLAQTNSQLERQVQLLNARRRLPKLVGTSVGFATKLEDRYGWDLKVSEKYSGSEAGLILAQSPSAGTMMRYNALFRVTVSKAIPKVPDLVGMSKAKAINEAEDYGYEVAIVEQISNEGAGTVLAMSPSQGSRVIPGDTITLTVAIKPPPPPANTSDSNTSNSGNTSNCTDGYSPCLPPAVDYDCLGGTGDGPKYTGQVTVTGTDPYDLDADGDGVGCES